jgi:hypothetical protein
MHKNEKTKAANIPTNSHVQLHEWIVSVPSTWPNVASEFWKRWQTAILKNWMSLYISNKRIMVPVPRLADSQLLISNSLALAAIALVNSFGKYLAEITTALEDTSPAIQLAESWCT